MAQTRSLHNRIETSTDNIAIGLGWFSIGLGLVQLFSPRALTRPLGMEGGELMMRAYGAREITTGLGLLGGHRRGPWLWGRVAGDALDIVTLLAAWTRNSGQQKQSIGIALAAVAGVTALDLATAQALTRFESQRKARALSYNYRNRSGLPQPPDMMRGAARDFEIPPDMRIPEALRPYPTT
jgi:hypothetical protein